MKCTKCGTENPQGKNVCLKCGAFLYSSNPKNRQPLTAEQRRSQRKARAKGNAMGCLWTLLIIVGTFVVLAVIIWLLVKYVLPADFIDYLYPTATSTAGSGAATTATTAVLP